jgi:hypothetical protein
LGTSAAAIVAAGEVPGLATGAPGKAGEPPRSSESRDKGLPTEPPRVRQEIDLTGRWLFQIDPWDEGLKLGFFSPDFPTQDWREVSVPRAFDIGPYGYVSRDRKTRLKAFSVVTKMFQRRRELLLKSEISVDV